MNNLDNILTKIDEDANEQIEKETAIVLSKARESAAQIISDAEKTASEIVKSAKVKSDFAKDATSSACDGYIARRILKEKSDIVSSCIEYVDKVLKEADTDKYFKMIEKLIIKYAHSENGMLILNKRDNDILPEKFIDNVNLIINKKNANIELSKEIGDFDGGFILRYGGIDENCTFDALIEEKIDIIKDAICKELREG